MVSRVSPGLAGHDSRADTMHVKMKDGKVPHAVLDGIFTLRQRIDIDSKHFLGTPPQFPYISAFLEHDDSSDEEHLRIVRLNTNVQCYCLLYISKMRV